MVREQISKKKDWKLIQDFRSGDLRAFDQLVMMHKDMVFNLCYKLLQNYDDANDCAQDTFIKAYDNLANLNKSKISDDAQLVEALGQKVSIVQTDPSNIKITIPADVAIAEAIIKSRPKAKKEGYIGPYAEAQW